MVTASNQYRTVSDLMNERKMELGELVRFTGLDDRVASAIAHQRYTPSPQQRLRVSVALGFPRNWIVWGHLAIVEELQARL
jgi:hypothetical protein